MTLISVVVPIYNEEHNIADLYKRLKTVLASLSGFTSEIIMVDDGSTDASLEKIKEAAEADPSVKYISFSRNFGHEPASTAGLDRAQGDCVVLIDADLQDPPEVIPQMVEKWRQGYHVVYAQRKSRPGESIFKKITSYLFYRIINLFSAHKFPLDTGDFRLIDRQVLLAFRKMGDYNRMIRGMIAWLGFKQTGIYYDREERKKGSTKYNAVKLFWLSLDALTSFSLIPLRFSMAIGFLVMLVSFIFGCIVIYQKLFGTLRIPGYALQTISTFFLGGIQLFMLGIIGEYLGKVYQQTQGRPLYVILEEGGFDRQDGNTAI